MASNFYARAVLTLGAILLFVVAGSPHAAHARDAGFYAGAADLVGATIDVNAHSESTGGVLTSATTGDRSETGWKLFGGYRFNPYFAIEGGYSLLGSFQFRNPAGGTTKLVGTSKPVVLSVDAIGSWPLAGGVSLYARAGLAHSKTKASLDDTGTTGTSQTHFKNTKWGYHAGIGAAWEISERFEVRIEWEHYRVADGFGEHTDVDLVSWGASYRF